jgi:ABC-2 type transport system ATP-binding protein
LAVIEAANVSKWYGQVIGVNDLTTSVEPGAVGLLGPNGAGKTTFLRLAAGLLKPSAGTVTVFGQSPCNNPALFRRIGVCPERDSFYSHTSGFQFLMYMSRLHGCPTGDAKEMIYQALDIVSLSKVMDRPVASYSRGMRQRLKLAQSIMHDPDVLLLDEPLSGMDPIGRQESIGLIRRLGEQGKTVLVSSHILYEVEAITRKILLINNGKVIAEGDVSDIRDLIDSHPHHISVESDRSRDLASLLISKSYVRGVEIGDDGTLAVETHKPREFYQEFPVLVIENGFDISSMTTTDDNIEAVFKYLVE